MDYQGCYRDPGCPVRRQEMRYDIGEGNMRGGEPTGYVPGMGAEDSSGYASDKHMRETVGYAPGMQAGQPEYGMEMQPEYGTCPYRMPHGANMNEPQEWMSRNANMNEPQGWMSRNANMNEPQGWMSRNTNMSEGQNRVSRGTNMAEPWNMTEPRGTNRMQPGNMGMGGVQMQPYGAMPYYQMPGYPQTLWQEIESDRDMQKLKEMYPDAAKEILPYVEEECDKMEYDGSVMFDEYPDRVMVGKIRNNIYDRVKDRFELPEDGDRDEMFAMNQETRRRYPPRKNWLGDLVDVLLFQEMHRRRCRHRNCKGWR